MKKLLPIVLLGIVVIASSCASKRLAKQGAKLESEGLYEQAADAYYQSAYANHNNVDALVGLKKNGQLVLDHKFIDFSKAYDSGNIKDAVYDYTDAQTYANKVSGVGVNLQQPERYKSMFDDAKSRYLKQIYPEAQLALNDENFTKAAQLLQEVQRLEPGYEKSNELLITAMAEPVYRDGIQSMQTSQNRKAYFDFDQLIKTYGSYKNSNDLKTEARRKALITVGIKPIESYMSDAGFATLLVPLITSSVNALNNPFLIVVDQANRQALMQEQMISLNTNSNIDVGNLLGVKAILTGKLVSVDTDAGKVQVQDMPGWIKEMVTKYDTSQKKNILVPYYVKSRYRQYTQTVAVSCTFQYQLISIETGAILVSDVINYTAKDMVQYAIYNGDVDKLVPGYWKYSERTMSDDAVYDNRNSISQLNSLFKSRQQLRTTDDLKGEIANFISKSVATKLNTYNPEVH
jgi:hypothetical protein